MDMGDLYCLIIPFLSLEEAQATQTKLMLVSKITKVTRVMWNCLNDSSDAKINVGTTANAHELVQCLLRCQKLASIQDQATRLMEEFNISPRAKKGD